MLSLLLLFLQSTVAVTHGSRFLRDPRYCQFAAYRNFNYSTAHAICLIIDSRFPTAVLASYPESVRLELSRFIATFRRSKRCAPVARSSFAIENLPYILARLAIMRP